MTLRVILLGFILFSPTYMTTSSDKDWDCLVVGSLLRDVWTMEGMELEYRDVRSRKRDPATRQNRNGGFPHAL
jgi:hypothetical protein